MQVTDEDLIEIQKGVLDKLRFHFILNSLNGVRYYIKKDPQKAYDMVYILSKYIIGKCDTMVNQKLIPLEEELEYANAYAKLEEIQRSLLTVKCTIHDKEGYVKAGSVYQEIEKLLKEEVYGSREQRTLEVERVDTLPGVCIRIKETEKFSMIPIHSMEGNM